MEWITIGLVPLPMTGLVREFKTPFWLVIKKEEDNRVFRKNLLPNMRAVLMEKSALLYCVLSSCGRGVWRQQVVSCYEDKQCYSGTEVEQKEEKNLGSWRLLTWSLLMLGIHGRVVLITCFQHRPSKLIKIIISYFQVHTEISLFSSKLWLVREPKDSIQIIRGWVRRNGTS